MMKTKKASAYLFKQTNKGRKNKKNNRVKGTEHTGWDEQRGGRRRSEKRGGKTMRNGM